MLLYLRPLKMAFIAIGGGKNITKHTEKQILWQS